MTAPVAQPQVPDWAIALLVLVCILLLLSILICALLVSPHPHPHRPSAVEPVSPSTLPLGPWPRPTHGAPLSPQTTCSCRRKSRGKLDLFSTKDSYHPMAEYPPYQSHGRYVSPNSKHNPYSQVRAERRRCPGTGVVPGPLLFGAAASLDPALDGAGRTKTAGGDGDLVAPVPGSLPRAVAGWEVSWEVSVPFTPGWSRGRSQEAAGDLGRPPPPCPPSLGARGLGGTAASPRPILRLGQILAPCSWGTRGQRGGGVCGGSRPGTSSIGRRARTCGAAAALSGAGFGAGPGPAVCCARCCGAGAVSSCSALCKQLALFKYQGPG